MKRPALTWWAVVICVAALFFGCSGGTQWPTVQTVPTGRISPIGDLPATATPKAPAANAAPDPEAADVVLNLEDFTQGIDEQSFTVASETSFSVDLDDWSVVTKSSTSERIGFPVGLVLAPGQRLIVHTKTGVDSATDVYLGLPADVAPRVFTPGDLKAGFIDIVSNEGRLYFRYLLPTETPNR